MSNTLNLGNGDWATKENSLLGYNSENGNYKPLPFDFTRASNGTFINKSGLIETAANGVPRIDFSDSTSGALLLEPQRTNLLTYSNDFINVAWSKNQSGTGLIPVVTSNSLISPDGTLNASKVVFNTGVGVSTSDVSMLEDTVTATSGVAINQSVYLRGENGGETILIRGANGGAYTTLTLTNEWVRYESTETSGATSSTWSIGLRQGLGGVVINSNVTIYMYAAQFEIGSYSTSLINTQGSAVTRVADVCNNGGNDQVINSNEGVLYFEGSGENDNTFNYISLSDGGTTNYAAILYTDTDNQILYRYYVGGSGVAITVNSIDVTNFNKIAIKWAANDFAIWINGIEVGTASSGNLNPSGTFNELAFARGGANNTPFYGKVKDVRVYNTALTDAELIALTS